MVGLRITVKGLDQVQGRLAHMITELQVAPGLLVNRVGRMWLVAMKGEAPRRTGRMADSLMFEVTSQSPTGASGRFRGVSYTAFVTGGTRPHEIFPRHGRHLRFVVGGHVAFARRVRHPGTKPNPFHVRALESIQGAIVRELERMGRAIIGEAA